MTRIIIKPTSYSRRGDNYRLASTNGRELRLNDRLNELNSEFAIHESNLRTLVQKTRGMVRRAR
jgi:hypothetical protein